MSTDVGHLRFTEVRDTGKTKVWSVSRADDGMWLGEVRWWPARRRWRSTLFDVNCLVDVCNFIQTQMEARKT